MKNIKRWVARILIFICIFVMSAVSVFAISVGQNAYINIQNFAVQGASTYEPNSTNAYSYTRLNENKTYLRMMFLSSSWNGVPKIDSSGRPLWVYCIEYGEDVSSTIERTVTNLASLDTWNEMSDTTRLAITLATLYGFPVSNLGCSAADAYAATQAVIWDYQTGIRTSLSSDTRKSVFYKGKVLEATRFSSMVEGKSGMMAYNNLIAKMISHSNLPNFQMDSVTLKFDENTGKYIAKITDKNGQLSNYNVTSNSADLNIIQNGNTLTLSTTKNLKNVKLTFNRKQPITTGQPLLGLKPKSRAQATVLGQTESNLSSYLPVKVDFIYPKFKIEVSKRGESLKGFIEENGINVPIYEEKYLEGCVVEIYAAEDIKTDEIERHRKGDLVDTLVTTKEGAVESKELFEGKYLVKEIEAPEGYVFVENKTIIDLKGRNLQVIINNNRQRFSFNFEKELEGITPPNEKFLEIEFGIYNKENILDLKKDSLLGKISPDKNGNCKVDIDLPFGYAYYLKELRTVEGFVLKSNIVEFDVVPFYPQESTTEIMLEKIVNERETTTIVTTTTPQIEIPNKTPKESETSKIPDIPEEVVETSDKNKIVPILLMTVFSFIGFYIITNKVDNN